MNNNGYGKPISVTLKFDYEKGEGIVPVSFRKRCLEERNIAMADFLKDVIFDLTEIYNGVISYEPRQGE